MKKVVSVLLVLLLFAAAFCVPAQALDGYMNTPDQKDEWLKNYPKSDKPALFADEIEYLLENNEEDDYWTGLYEELYYHYDADGAVDWALIHYNGLGTMMDYDGLNGTVMTYGNMVTVDPFTYSECYYVYLPNSTYTRQYSGYTYTRQFVALSQAWGDEARFEGLKDAVYRLVDGNWIGDANLDGALTIDDATFTQQCLAEMEAFRELQMPDIDVRISVLNPKTGRYDYLRYLGDANRDGKHNIDDATQIQRWLAGLEAY